MVSPPSQGQAEWQKINGSRRTRLSRSSDAGGSMYGTSMAHRLDQAEDFVRLEIESAMAKGMPVIPVLVENANMRSVGDTGQHDAICYRNARPILQGPYFGAGMDRLIEQIDRPDGEPAVPKQQFCVGCGKALAAGQRLCTGCGRPAAWA